MRYRPSRNGPIGHSFAEAVLQTGIPLQHRVELPEKAIMREPGSKLPDE